MEIVFIVTIIAYLWRCTFELVFGDSIDLNIMTIVTILAYAAHIIIFNVTEHKNEKSEIISNRN